MLSLTGATWKAFNAAALSVRRQRAHMYGLNDMAVGRPVFVNMLARVLGSPIYVIQVWCCRSQHSELLIACCSPYLQVKALGISLCNNCINLR